jgi:hypothetical protein
MGSLLDDGARAMTVIAPTDSGHFTIAADPQN